MQERATDHEVDAIARKRQRDHIGLYDRQILAERSRRTLRDIEAPRGGCWHPTGVARLRQRLAPPHLRP